MVNAEKPYRSKRKLTYHGRTGHLLIHTCEKGKHFIMVRKKGGGTQRLFLDKHRNVPASKRGKKK